MLTRVRKPAAGEKRLIWRKIPRCCSRQARLAASKRAWLSGSRPKAFVTITPCTPSVNTSTIRSTSERLRVYSGWMRREKRTAMNASTGVVARQASVSVGLSAAMYVTYTVSEIPMITLCIRTWSTNMRTDCTSPVTRVMIEPVEFASKNRKLRRCSFS